MAKEDGNRRVKEKDEKQKKEQTNILEGKLGNVLKNH